MGIKVKKEKQVGNQIKQGLIKIKVRSYVVNKVGDLLFPSTLVVDDDRLLIALNLADFEVTHEIEVSCY